MLKFVNFAVKLSVTNAGKRRELSPRKVDHLVGLKSHLKKLISLLIQMKTQLFQATSGQFVKFATESFLLNKFCKTITFRLNAKLKVYSVVRDSNNSLKGHQKLYKQCDKIILIIEKTYKQNIRRSFFKKTNLGEL